MKYAASSPPPAVKSGCVWAMYRTLALVLMGRVPLLEFKVVHALRSQGSSCCKGSGAAPETSLGGIWTFDYRASAPYRQGFQRTAECCRARGGNPGSERHS